MTHQEPWAEAYDAMVEDARIYGDFPDVLAEHIKSFIPTLITTALEAKAVEVGGMIDSIDEMNVKGYDLHAGLHNAINHVLGAITEKEIGDARSELFRETRELLRHCVDIIRKQ